MSGSRTIVSMGLSHKSMGQVDELKSFFNAENRTDAIVCAVRLTTTIAQAIEQGSTIQIAAKNGELFQLVVDRGVK